MLIIGLIIGACIGFYNFAKENGLNVIFWALAPILGYLGLAFGIGIVIGLTAPELVSSTSAMVLLDLGSAVAAVLILYLLMKQAADKKKQSKAIQNEDIIDTL
jgi:hypothetical protein